MSSLRRTFRLWLHRMLSFWKLPMQLLSKSSSKCGHLRFSDRMFLICIPQFFYRSVCQMSKLYDNSICQCRLVPGTHMHPPPACVFISNGELNKCCHSWQVTDSITCAWHSTYPNFRGFSMTISNEFIWSIRADTDSLKCRQTLKEA